MFSKATANFVRQIDPEGSLIHVSRINDSHNLGNMALVVKRNRFWFWQKPKYHPTVFTLTDILQGDKVIIPGVSESEFLTYKGTFGDKLAGKLDTEAASLGLTVEGQGSSMLQSCFGKLKKEELDVKKLLRDSCNRHVNMHHKLVQQMEKRAEVLTVVNERILTTSSCSVTHTRTEHCTFKGVLGLVGLLGSSVKVCVKDSNDIEADSDVSLEIPGGTVIAYSILELGIKKNGDFDICLQPGTIGGIESDATEESWPPQDPMDMVDGKCNWRAMQNGSGDLDLSPLAALPKSTRRALFRGLQETLKDRAALSYLQSELEDLCHGETLDTGKQEDLSESQRQLASVIQERLTIDDSPGGVPAHLHAAHLLVSAMEELPDDALRILSQSCPDFLEAVDTLTCRLMESREPLSLQCPPMLLQENQAFQLAKQLLCCANVTLKRDADRIWMEAENKAGVQLLVLYLAIHGLTLLCKEMK